MAKILLIETSSEVCSAAISVDGVVVALAENLEAKSHVALLTLQISECSEKVGIPLAQIDAVAVSRGPGAYTALRVGASVAKGICYALEKPLIAVDTLRALAYGSRIVMGETVNSQQSTVNSQQPTVNGQRSMVISQHPTVFVPMLDARRQEVWLAMFDSDLREIAPVQPLILENNSFEKYVAEKTGTEDSVGVILSGNGMKKIRSGGFLKNLIFSEVERCSARHLAILAEQCFQNADFQDIAYFEPHYMKPPNITVPNRQPF